MTFSKLESLMQFKILRRITLRKKKYVDFSNGNSCTPKILLIGDRPGPSAPQSNSYHHTPFYSVKHCSGWLNLQLEINSVPESDLLWINSADYDGTPTNLSLLENCYSNEVIALGHNAARWFSSYGKPFIKLDHPQYWKRFKSKEAYPLIDYLKQI